MEGVVETCRTIELYGVMANKTYWWIIKHFYNPTLKWWHQKLKINFF